MANLFSRRANKKIGDQFKVSDRIGTGAFGHVYRGTMKQKQEEVAVKRLKIEGQNYEDIKKEYERLKDIQDKANIINIVKLLGLGKDNNFIDVGMELGDCGDLNKFLKDKEYNHNLDDKITIMHGTASALNYMHTLDVPIVHMNIKPGNIVITKVDSGIIAKVCDFGFARVFTPNDNRTNMYSAPELFASNKEVCDASIDTYALGLVYFAIINFNGLHPLPSE